MHIEFCSIEDGEVIFTKESEEMKDVISVITKVGTEIKLSFSKNDFIHGYVRRVMYFFDAEKSSESLRIFISDDYINNEHIDKLPPEKLETEKLESVKISKTIKE